MSDARLTVYRRNVETRIERAVTVQSLAQVYTYTAGETVGGHKVVYIENGTAYIADAGNVGVLTKPIGVTTGAATAGSPVDVMFFGLLNGFNNLASGVYFLGSNGDIVSTQSGAVYCEIGRAINTTTMFVNVQLMIRR